MSSAAVEQPVPPQDALAWEAEHRKRSGIAAVVAAVLTLIGAVLAGTVYADQPHVAAVQAMKFVVGELPAGTPGLLTPLALYLNDHAVALVLSSLLTAAGAALFIPILGFLHRASAARSARATKIALYAAIIGPAAYAIGIVVLQIATTLSVSDFAGSSDHSTQAAHDALYSGGFLISGRILVQLGQLVVALAFILVALNAQRVGLLSRFMGILGMIAGGIVLVGPLIAPQLASLPVLEIFWLFAVGLLVLQRWPGRSIPPAWSTGKAEPWPTQQQLREERDRENARRKSERDAAADHEDEPAVEGVSAPMPVPRDEEPAGTPHSSSKKKKRKRR